MHAMKCYTTEEKHAYEEVKKIIGDKLTPKQLQDETFYHRFLKARDFNVQNTVDLIKKHLSDHELYDLNDLSSYTPPQHITTYYSCSVLGYDKEGSCVYYIDMGCADLKGLVTLFDFKELIRYSMYFLDKDIKQMTEVSPKSGKQVSKIVFLMNMEKLSLFQVTSKKVMETLYTGFQLIQDNYPERIKAVYIINAFHYFYIAYAVLKNVLSTVLQEKIQIFNKSGWQEVLLQNIDADILPAFLGGKRTDPDGNPFCNSFIIHGSKIPEDLLSMKSKKPLSQENGVKKLTVNRFSTSEVAFYVYDPETCIEWEFETKAKDISFGLNYRDTSKLDPTNEELIPLQRVDTLLGSETGLFKCDKAGTYIMIFDNSHSWMFAKDIYYRIRLVKPQDQESQIKTY